MDLFFSHWPKKERHLQREAEAQLEFMQGTVLRLLEENKKQGMRRVILEDEKKKMEGELRALVLHTGSQGRILHVLVFLTF